MKKNPCLSCGACCAFYRASFYWSETDEFTPGGVPAGLTEQMNDFRLTMIGTQGPAPRCIALEGEIGANIFCRIYENRAGVCRVFEPSWENNAPNLHCDMARLAWGLKPLTTESWFDPSHIPSAA